MSLAERRGLRLFTFSAMFFAQGIGWAFMAYDVPAYISARGMPITATGTVLAITVLPFAFKWVWGPIMDAFTLERFGRRRPWLIFTQAMMAVSIAALLFVDDFVASFDLLLVVMLIHTVFNAMQNVATDALALDLLSETERGRANGIMYGSKYAGGFVGGFGMSELAEHAGMRWAIVAMVVMLGAITLVPLLVRERVGPPPPRRPIGDVLGALGRVLRLPSVVVAGVVMLAHNFAGGVLAAVSPVLFTQGLKWDADEYSQISGGPGLAAGFAGSLLAGFLADKLGHRRLAVIALAALGTVWLGFALDHDWWSSRVFTYPLFVIEPFCQATMIVALWTLCMDTTTRQTATTQFALYTSLMNASTLIASKLLVGAIASWDVRTIYFVAAGSQLVLVALVAAIDIRQARRELGE